MKSKIIKNKSDLYFPCTREFSIENNPYRSIVVDITQRCNLDCNVCFNPVRSNQFDMGIDYFEEVCKRLPNPVSWKIIGGEPTMHPDFFDFLRIAYKHGHHAYFSSNGYKFLDDDFMRELKDLPFAPTPGMTMDGGYSSEKSDEVYTAINDRPLRDLKLEALESLHKYKIGRVALHAILVRDYNEYVVGDMLNLADKYSDMIRYVQFRTMAKIGNWVDTEPFVMTDLKRLMAEHFTEEQLLPKSVYEVVCTPEDEYYSDCCFRFRPTKRLQVSLIEFAAERGIKCPWKGKLIDEEFVVQSFHENLIEMNKSMTSALDDNEYGLVRIDINDIQVS